MIKLENMEKKFDGGGLILKEVNAVINNGDIIAVIGPSGTGKSTLLRCINMLDGPSNGKIYIDDVEITAKGYSLNEVHLKIGMVFQSFNLFEHLSVIENIMLPQMSVLKRGKQEAYDIGMDLLSQVGMAQKWGSYPSALSGGQKQRVAIARTLAMNPDIILFDEPTSALDPSMVDEVKAVIRDVAKTGKTIMIVTHDMDFARKISNRVFYMDEQGIYEDGTPEQIFDDPQKPKTRLFIRRVKTMEEDIDIKDFDFQGLMSSIYSYGNRIQLAPKVIYNMQIMVEELVCNIIIPNLKTDSRIHLGIGYSDEKKRCGMMIAYGGEPYDAFKIDDGVDDGIEDVTEAIENPVILTVRILKSLIDEYQYTHDSNAELCNIIRFSMKE